MEEIRKRLEFEYSHGYRTISIQVQATRGRVVRQGQQHHHHAHTVVRRTRRTIQVSTHAWMVWTATTITHINNITKANNARRFQPHRRKQILFKTMSQTRANTIKMFKICCSTVHAATITCSVKSCMNMNFLFLSNKNTYR